MDPSHSLWMCLTRTCNFDCGYCYQGSHAVVPEKLSHYMSEEVISAALPWVVRWATRGLTLIWYGGEPLLALPLIKKWMPLYAQAFKDAGKSIRFTCTTNGSLLSQEVREMFDEYQVGVLLSLDGPPYLHDKSRTYYDKDPVTGARRGTWSSIPIDDILAWRPCGPSRVPGEPWRNIEIAWQISPGIKVEPKDLDWMIEHGFRSVNFNLQWLEEWNGDQRIWLEEFFRKVGREAIKGNISTNWKGNLDKALTIDKKMEQPCGTGLQMLGLSPEGWLYPSQEMVYTAFQPGKAPGTAEYYRIGDVRKSPIIDMDVLVRVSQIRTEQMRPPPPFDCENCIAKSASIGGCHCRYIGQDGRDPANRFDVKPGYCQSMQSAVTGLVQAAAIERYIRPVSYLQGKQVTPCGHNSEELIQVQTKKVDLEFIAAQLTALKAKMDELPIVRIEEE